MSTTDKAAWVHPNPLLTGWVVLPDGYHMTRKEAEAKGFTVTPWPDTERTAAPHPHEKDSVVLPRGQVVSLDTAKSSGFVLSASVQATTPDRSWRSAIMRLPEAQSRTSAAAELLTSQSPETMTVESARAFLRGLPTEQAEEQPTLTTNNDDPRAARIAEINRSMAAFNKGNGYRPKAQAAASSPSLAGVDPVKLKRLTEIRLSAINPHSKEYIDLRYALEAHDKGMPLGAALAQLHVDTSKIVRS